jgi:hypothetical protein
MTATELGAEKYISLTTYKKDGTPVATPLWAVPDGDAVALWTVTDSWKVKRIRRNPEVTLTPCDFRGRLTGDPVPGRAEIMSPEGSDRVRGLIRRKYGLIGRVTMWLSLRRRGREGTVGIRVLI